ncbi:Uncharacterised protein [Vibrio cholerae]|nr:Uncharacterised protein [Vibrio cholerae]
MAITRLTQCNFYRMKTAIFGTVRTVSKVHDNLFAGGLNFTFCLMFRKYVSE